MKKTTYSPAQVVNPSSENHMVKLYPNQNLRLVLPEEEDSHIYLTSEYLRLTEESTDKKKGNIIYNFVQEYDLTEWAKVSWAYLGEIAILTKDRIASCCIMLNGQECHNENVITIVNPVGTQIKTDPHKILEIVVFDVDSDDIGSWDYEIHAGKEGVEFEYIGQEVVYPAVHYKVYIREDDISDMTLVMPRSIKEIPRREHHFFFRCSYDSLRTLKEGGNGTYDGGRICFFPETERDSNPKPLFKHVVNLSLNVRNRNKEKMFDSLFFSKSYQIVSTPQCLKNSTASRVIYPKRSSSAGGILTPNNYKNTSTKQTRRSTQYSYGSTTWKTTLYVPTITLKPKSTKSIDAGCKVAYCIKIKKKKKRISRK